MRREDGPGEGWRGTPQREHSCGPLGCIDAFVQKLTCAFLGTEEKAELVSGLLAAKEASGKSFTVIANELGLTNAFTANLFMNQARLTEALAPALQKAVPRLTNAQVAAMQRCPMRSFDTAILQVGTMRRFLRRPSFMLPQRDSVIQHRPPSTILNWVHPTGA
jgi:hypothetical protein